MVELNENEPFHWDVEWVVKELCTQERTWDVPASYKLPDPKWLASKLRELDVDGESLLIYADEFGWPTFWKVLGIEDPAHHLSIQEAIKQFRETSTLYYRQKRDIDLPEYPPCTTPAIKPDLLNPSKPTPLIIDRSIQEPTTAAIGGPVSKPSLAEVDSAVTEASPTIASLEKSVEVGNVLGSLNDKFTDKLEEALYKLEEKNATGIAIEIAEQNDGQLEAQ